MDEYEKSELVRQWLRDNASALIGGVAVGLIGIMGWQWMQHSKAQHRVDAAATYAALEQAAEQNEATRVDQLASELSEKFGDTTYGALGLMQLADKKLAGGEVDAAISTLQNAIKAAQSPALKGLATVRLARVQVDTGQAQAALDSLTHVGAGDYAGLVAEIRGDALLALGRTSEAEAAYRDALTLLDTAAPTRSIVEMKLADLGASIDESGV